MPTISGPLSVVTEAPAVVTAVWVQAPALRTHVAGAILPQRAPATLTGSTVSFPCAPGPAVLTWQVGGMEDQVPILVDDVESQTLAEVVRAARLAEGRTADELAALVQQVLDGAAAAGAAATSATGSASSAASSATAAAQSAVNAANSEWVAGEHKGAAEAASDAAASSASAAAASAGAAASSESAAATSAGEAAASAGAASDAADRAENVVDTVQWQGDQLSVMGKVSPPLTGDDGETPHVGANGNWWVGDTDTGVRAQGPKGDPGDGHGDVLWSELDPVLDGKANTSHTHTKADITDLETVSTGAVPNSIVKRTTDGTIHLPSTPSSSSAATSKYYVDTEVGKKADASHTHSQYATTAQVEARTPEIRVVSSLPSSPLPGVVYLVTG